MFWLGAVGIPYGALIVIAIYEALSTSHTFNKGVLEAGVNACILGIGVTGALFSTPEIGKKIGISGFAIAFVVLLVDLALVGFCLHLRKKGDNVGYGRAILSILLGLLSIGINTGIVILLGGPTQP